MYERGVAMDRNDYHAYGLIQVRPGVYEKCYDDCCKSGGPVNWERYYARVRP
jgi:hypothetical protein